MKHLQKYIKFYSMLTEQEATVPPAEGEAKKVEAPGVPDWFKTGFFTGIGSKYSKQLGIDQKDLVPTWEIVKKLMEFKKLNFVSVKEVQQYLWKMMGELDCFSKGGDADAVKLIQQVNDFRKSKGLGPVSEQKFIDGKYGLQTHTILMTAVCLAEVELSAQQQKIAEEQALKNVDVKKSISSEEIVKNVEEEGKTGLPENELIKKAQTIINDSLIPDESTKSDKFKLGANKMGARIVYKDKGTSKLGADELAILDEYFGLDGFSRIKSKEKRYGIKYVWKKILNVGPDRASKGVALDASRKKPQPQKPEAVKAPTEAEQGGGGTEV